MPAIGRLGLVARYVCAGLRRLLSADGPGDREAGSRCDAEVRAGRSLKEPTRRAPAPKAAPSRKGEQELERAVKSYEEGAHKNAARQFQAALDFGLNAKADRATAHKYLAFIVCVSGREKSCRDEFRKALDADPELRAGAGRDRPSRLGPRFPQRHQVGPRRPGEDQVISSAVARSRRG